MFNATIGVIDAATAPISKLASIAKNPVVQGASLIGASFGVAESVNSFQDFESMMSQVKAISGATGQAFDDLTAKAQEMGATTKFTATESAEAFNYMAMAGWKPQQMIDGISGIMSLAAASGEDLGTTSDIVTDALTAFGLSAGDSGHFADVLAQASANANTNVSMLGESFKYVAPVAGAMNYSVEDTSLALGLMANASIKGSMAGTALKTSLANMAAPTDSMAEAMDKYGISLTDSEGNMKSLRGVIDNLRGSLGGLSETEQTAAASTIFGKEAMAGMLAIINASEEDYNKLSTAIDNSKDAAEGIRQKILTRGKDDSLDEAKKEAKEVLDDDGKPKEEIKVVTIDIPIIRKGDIIHLKMSSTGSGYYWVKAITHDCDKMEMTMTLKKTKLKSSSSKKDNKKKDGDYSIGDTVNFHGGYHYVSSDATSGYKVSAGKATITHSNPGSAHPWCLENVNWAETHVCGWVDEGSFD